MGNIISFKLILCILLGGLSQKAICQSCGYSINEKDSLVTITDTIVIAHQKSFYLKITDPLPNHPYYLTFPLKNQSDSAQYIILGSEGVIRPITKQILLQPGETQMITYQFHNVRDWCGSFSQAGRIRSRAANTEGENLSPITKFQSFLIAGEWKYGK